MYILLVFPLLVPKVNERGVLDSLIIIMNLSTSPFHPVSCCFMDFEAQLLAYTFKILMSS